MLEGCKAIRRNDILTAILCHTTLGMHMDNIRDAGLHQLINEHTDTGIDLMKGKIT
jgi:UDP-N-acetylglucosamine 2-epimerase